MNPEPEFLVQLNSVIEANIANEQFGVSELADAMNMSRSNLLRKVKKEANVAVNQLIRDTRLKRAMQLLQETSLNVSEVGHQVGFNSTSYFIKCFRENYGYPPGEVGKRGPEPIVDDVEPVVKRSKTLFYIIGAAVVLIGAFAFWWWMPFAGSSKLERSIAVLPFKNDSNDSSNVYLINGLMESTLNNLQKIEDLKVISRTSSEKYRNQRKSIPEMAKELNVSYFVEGSGQKIGNQILLNIQLIEGKTDRHLWSKQYKREVSDIFALQQEIAASVAAEIQGTITPEERMKIEKVPTNNLEAYDFFLKGREMMFRGEQGSLEKAIDFFNKSIEHDNKFSLAYAGAAIAYYYRDIYQKEQKFVFELETYSDKAMLYDAKSDESLVAKALCYIQKKEYDQAVLFLERALEYNPNSGTALTFISDLYNSQAPNTAKYLQYALIGARINVAVDSTTASYRYMHLSNALIQTGFVDEAIEYVNKSLAYNPNNPFAAWIKVGIEFSKDKDTKKAIHELTRQFDKDTTRFYLLQEIGKLYYGQRDYNNAWRFYKRFIKYRDEQHLDFYGSESMVISIVMSKLGMKEQSDVYLKLFKTHADNDKTVYKDLNYASYYKWIGDKQKALAYLRAFSEKDNFQFWILFLPEDPQFDDMREDPEFKKAVAAIQAKFWANHRKLSSTLEEKRLL